MDKNTGSSVVTENNPEGNIYYFAQCFEKHRLSLSGSFSDAEPFEILDKIMCSFQSLISLAVCRSFFALPRTSPSPINFA